MGAECSLWLDAEEAMRTESVSKFRGDMAC